MTPSASRKSVRRRHRNKRQKPGKQQGGTLWFAGVLVAVVVIAGVLVLVNRDSDALAGEIVAESTEYDFGKVQIDGGIVSTRFPLTALDPAQITKIQST